MPKPTGSRIVVAGAGVIALAIAATATSAVGAPRFIADKIVNATFTVRMTLNGAVKGHLVFKVVELQTPCTGGTGIGSAGVDGVPSPDGEHVRFNGVELQYAINNSAYKGPGTYPTKDFANTSAAISADKASEPDPFAPANSSNATETLLWHKNGSGSFIFKNWDNAETTRALDGKFTWTCKN